MSSLTILGNEVNKDAKTQFEQVQTALYDIQEWSETTKSKNVLEVIESETADATTTSTSYVDIPEFTRNFALANPFYLLMGHFCLSGVGFVGIFVNDELTKEYYFDHGTNVINVPVFDQNRIKTGTNNLKVKWRAESGTITRSFKGRSSIQIANANS